MTGPNECPAPLADKTWAVRWPWWPLFNTVCVEEYTRGATPNESSNSDALAHAFLFHNAGQSLANLFKRVYIDYRVFRDNKLGIKSPLAFQSLLLVNRDP